MSITRRIDVVLNDSDYQNLKKRAEENGVSMSELLRQGVGIKSTVKPRKTTAKSKRAQTSNLGAAQANALMGAMNLQAVRINKDIQALKQALAKVDLIDECKSFEVRKFNETTQESETLCHIFTCQFLEIVPLISSAFNSILNTSTQLNNLSAELTERLNK